MVENVREEGLALYRDGRYAAALAIFLADDADPADDPEQAYFMGLCHARLHENGDAIRLLESVLRGERNIARLYQTRMLLSLLLLEEGDITGAEHRLREVLQEGFESPQVYSALGYCQWRRDEIDPAMESYRRAAALDEKNPTAANGLGYLLAERGDDPLLAVELCRRALEQDPENLAYKDSLGWALFRAGDTADAVRYLTEALSARPGDAVIESHLEAVRANEHHVLRS